MFSSEDLASERDPCRAACGRCRARIGKCRTPSHSGYYGVGPGVGVGVGVGVPAAQVKSDSTRCPGSGSPDAVVVVALLSVQLPLVATVQCMLLLLTWVVMFVATAPQLKSA